MKASIRQAAAVAALGVALFGMASAQAAGAPPMHKVDGIWTISGGIGDGEAAAIQSEARHWPLTLEFAIKDKARSDYAADVNVNVRDAQGRTVLQTTSGGPFLLARLNPGRIHHPGESGRQNAAAKSHGRPSTGPASVFVARRDG